MTQPHVVKSVADLRRTVRQWKRDGHSVAMVPTMGALHEGHISLVEHAMKTADRCVVSIFVNPKQFAPTEDLDKYPRQLQADLDRLSTAGAHLAYTPGGGDMYPSGFDLKVSVGGPSRGLETDFRPQFFDGVATVVAKLFLQATPDFAIFGEKDYQQLCVVKKLCRDLDIPVEIVGAPTVRDSEGLAMSSRNAYLSPGELQVARQLNRIMRRGGAALTGGADETETLANGVDEILAAGFRKVDYLAVRESGTLASWKAGKPGRILAAAWLGTTRLIDNMEISS
jgi:pantoate--beta-alanine ligase